MSNSTKKSITLKAFIQVSIVSIIIGTVIYIIMAGTWITDIKSLLINAGYSLMIGIGLFANRFVYNYLGSRWISWTQRPIRSTIIAILVTLLYSSIVILFVNWFWFSVVIKIKWNTFREFGYNIIISEYIALTLVTLFMYARVFFNDWRKAIINEEKLKQQAIELQYKVLSNQVNPHFLFNSLNILNSLITINPQKAQNFVSKLSDFYRKLLDFRNEDIIPLQQEVDFVRLYIDLQKERFGENFQVEIKINPSNYYIIPMTLQLLIENAIKHNQISKTQHLTITIGCTTDNYLKVSNTYAPYSTPIDGKGLGLANLNERYQYFTERPLLIDQTDKLFTVKVPLLTTEI